MVGISRLRPSYTRLPPTFDAFRHPGFRLLWPANFFSYISRWMQMTLLIWFILDITDSPFFVALVGFSGMIPLLLFGVFGGVLADRVDRRKVLITSQLINLTATTVMIVLLLTGLVQFWHGYIVALASGMGWAIDMPSRRSIVHDLIGHAGVTNAMALDSVGMHGSRMAGPALAGGLIAAVGVTGGFYAVVTLYLASFAFILMLRPPTRTVPSTKSTSVISNLLEGFGYVRTNRVILATVVITVLMNLLLFPYMQMVPVIATNTLGVGPGLMGIMMGADGLGAIVGSVSIASAGQLRYHGRVYLGGSLIGLVMVLAFAGSQWFEVSLAILILLGLGTAGFGTMQATIVVISSSEEMRGRALGVISLAIGAGPLGALLIGTLAEASSPAKAIVVFACLGLLSLSAIGLLMPEIRGQMGQRSDPPQPDTRQAAVQRS